jgi:hypothetical protein
MEPLRSHATIRRADGSVEHVDLDMPPEFLTSPSDDLLEMRMSGWQHADEQHPAGGGRPGYRVAYKTVKLMPAKDITIPLPQDSRLKVAMGSLNRGGVHTPDGVPGRQPAHHVVPEYGTLSTDITGAVRYIRCLNPAMSFEAWEEELGGLSYVEIICGVEDAAANDPDALREAGRSKVVALKTMLDLMFGPRLLGIPYSRKSARCSTTGTGTVGSTRSCCQRSFRSDRPSSTPTPSWARRVHSSPRTRDCQTRINDALASLASGIGWRTRSQTR